MSFIDDVLNGYVQIEVAKAQGGMSAAASSQQAAGAEPNVPTNPQARAENATAGGSNRTMLYIAGGAALLLVAVAFSASGKKK